TTGQFAVDERQAHQHPLDDGGHVDVTELEGERVGDVVLLGRCHAPPEQGGLPVLVVGPTSPHLRALHHAFDVDVSTVFGGRQERAAAAHRVRQIGGASAVHRLL